MPLEAYGRGSYADRNTLLTAKEIGYNAFFNMRWLGSLGSVGGGWFDADATSNELPGLAKLAALIGDDYFVAQNLNDEAADVTLHLSHRSSARQALIVPEAGSNVTLSQNSGTIKMHLSARTLVAGEYHRQKVMKPIDIPTFTSMLSISPRGLEAPPCLKMKPLKYSL